MVRPRELHLSRPLYEGLPFIYILCGAASLVASYLQESFVISLILGALGVVCVVGGIAVLLRRRDYRAMRENYGESEISPTRED